MSPAAMSHFAAVLPCASALIRILFNLAPSGDVNSFRTPWGTVPARHNHRMYNCSFHAHIPFVAIVRKGLYHSLHTPHR
ncbi:hypothetical protein [Cupriavidus alkaliphilus]|uniref:hypothetical protein n=1 Tax=Cupriavidus alkaliphilus TaxID=942866 RepID=UPI00339D842A